VLKLPPLEGNVAGKGCASKREQLHEIRADSLRVVERLVKDHPASEITQHLVAGLAGRQHDLQGIRAVVGIFVGAQAVPKRLGRTQHPLVVREVETAAVHEGRSAAVDEVRITAAQPDVPRLDPVVPAVCRDDEHECESDRGGADEPLPPACAGDEREHNRRNDEDRADRADGRGQAEQCSARRESGEGRRPRPEQQHDRGENEYLEQRFRHDVLLDLELVRVEQDRHRGEHGNPSPDAEPDEQGVDRDAHAQPEEVLQPDDDREIAHREHRAEQERDVPDGLRGLRRVEVQISEVLVRVDVEQGGPVGDLGHDPQREAEPENGKEDPMCPRTDAKALPARGAEPAVAPVA